MQPQTILHFWFTELTPKDHFAKDPALDDSIRTRFGATLAAAARCELFAWRTTPEGRLAEVLVLDQIRAFKSEKIEAETQDQMPARYRQSR